MRFTRRFRVLAVLAVGLAAFGALVDAVAPIVGAAALGAWLFARAAVFVASLRALDAALDVVTTLSPDRTVRGGPVTVALGARVETPSDLAVRVTPDVPPGVEGDRPALTLDAGETAAEAGAEVSAAIAGRHEFGRPTVRASSPDGLFLESFPVGEPTALTAEPRESGRIHIGAGGEQVTVAYGEHPGGTGDAGIDPAELRAYAPGDPAKRIDWKATARLGDAHVRDFESETDRRTVLLLDHAGATRRGRPGETELDVLREVALAVTGAAEAWDDPLGCYTVGDAGLTGEFPPATTARSYDAVREHLHGLTPTAAAEHGAQPRDADPALANRRAAALVNDDTSFGRTLRPFFANEGYTRRVDGEPLFAAAGHLSGLGGQFWTVLLTDDRNRSVVREAVKRLRRNGNHVLCVLAPASLYGASEADGSDAYRRYEDFEQFRSNLASLPRVTALEAAPEDRLEAALAGREVGA